MTKNEIREITYELRGRIAILEAANSLTTANEALTLASQALARNTESNTITSGTFNIPLAFELVPRIGNTVGLYSGKVYHGATLLTEVANVAQDPADFAYAPDDTFEITETTYIWIEHYRQLRTWSMQTGNVEPTEDVDYGYTMLHKLAWDATNGTIDVENSVHYHTGGNVYLGAGPPVWTIDFTTDIVYLDPSITTEAADATSHTFDGTVGVYIAELNRSGYYHNGNERPYAYSRGVYFDRFGQLKSFGREIRQNAGIDVPITI